MKGIQSRRILMALGVMAFLAGVAMVAIGLFSYFGQADSGGPGRLAINSEYRDTVRVRTIPATTPSPTPEQPTPATPPLTAAYRMIIESIDIDAAVETYNLDENGIPQVPTGENAGQVVAWYDFSAQPGTGSNAVFAGHYTWNGLAVFYNLGELEPGDTIKLVGQDGTELVYSVSDNFPVDPADPAALRVMQPTPTDTITLITCGGTWIPDPNSEIGGDYTNRVVVRASLVSVNAVGAAEASSTGGG